MELRVWQELAEDRNAALVRLAGEVAPGDVAGVERLRRVCTDVEVVRAALMLAEARRKGVAKFGAGRAARLWADPEGVEMASSLGVARYKALRMSHAFGCEVLLSDLCCGIGGDAMALGRAMPVQCVDIDPVRAWMAGMNTGCASWWIDAVGFDVSESLVHIDPARREAGGGRVWRSEDLRPTLAQVHEIINGSGWGGAVKLGPGADLSEIERELPGCTVEVISERGDVGASGRVVRGRTCRALRTKGGDVDRWCAGRRVVAWDNAHTHGSDWG